MRRNATVTKGWTPLTPVMDATLICAETCRTNIAWTAGLTEIQVFDLNASGVATPLEVPVYTYQ